MPNGDVTISRVPYEIAAYGKTAKLLDNIPSSAATGNVYTGPWVDITTLKAGQVDVFGTGLTGTVNIEGTNKDNPAVTDTGFAMCTAPTATSRTALTMPSRWIRARVSGFTAGALTVMFHGTP